MPSPPPPISKEEGANPASAAPWEAGMEITAVDRSGHPMAAPAEAVPAAQAAENREIVKAVQAVNGTEMFGDESQLVFQRDPESHRMVVRLVNRKTGEVIAQIPPEYVLRLAEDLKPKTGAAT